MANKRGISSEYKGQIYDFIIEDRNLTKSVLEKVLSEADTQKEYKDHGLVAAKLIDTLQRSAEQMVKLIAIEQKNAPIDEDTELNDEEKKEVIEQLRLVK
jgi:metal-dependent HD superfamily phosphatase/phosphodiesterase